MDRTLKPATGLPLALVVGMFSFAVVRVVGEGLINYVMNPLFDRVWAPLVVEPVAELPRSWRR